LSTRFLDKINKFLGFVPTEGQAELFHKLEGFMRDREGKPMFVLSGYAGTGKTSALGAFVRSLLHFKVKTKLMAPTGRAAKVLAQTAGIPASTIHRQIYWQKSKTEFGSGLSLRPNLHKNTVFIVDEASMIGEVSIGKDGTMYGRDLLNDLISYVYAGEGCKLILLGDEGQLPPVGCDHSPAMDVKYLNFNYPQLKITKHKLTKVLRQEVNSSILYNATLLRETEWVDYPRFDLLTGDQDLNRITGAELQEELERSYDQYGQEETLVIVRSNKQANEYNRQIRGRILWYEEQLCRGDVLMVVKNNYYWQDDEGSAGFIANGEMIELRRILKTENYYGFEFVTVEIRFSDRPELGDFEVVLHTAALDVEGPNLPRSRMKELFYAVEEDYKHLRRKKERYEAILKDKYFNALQVKYAYAVTCHKSQGGQWKSVFIDQGYLSDEMLGPDYYRWLYTALTRGTDQVYLVNFKDEFFT
jgi:exodeoxyribonuclease-5